MPLDGTDNALALDQLRRWKEIREIIWRARTNMAIPGRWARWNWGANGQLCCASHVAVAAGATERALRSGGGIREALTPIGEEAIERLGGLRNIVAHNDAACYTLEDVLEWLDGHIHSLTHEIDAMQRRISLSGVFA